MQQLTRTHHTNTDTADEEIVKYFLDLVPVCKLVTIMFHGCLNLLQTFGNVDQRGRVLIIDFYQQVGEQFSVFRSVRSRCGPKASEGVLVASAHQLDTGCEINGLDSVRWNQ